MLYKAHITLRMVIACLVVSACCSFISDQTLHELAEQIRNKLDAFHYNDPAVRKHDISLTDDGFLRYRKTFTSGKQEYYSCNLSRLKDIDYMGSTDKGGLLIHTLEDDVIVQTYNDKEGNIDSMATSLVIPLAVVEAEDLVFLQQNLLEMKRLLHPK
jgi:hypothetical protein